MNAEIEKIVYFAKNPREGACGSVINLFDTPFPKKTVEYEPDEEYQNLLTDFFARLREKKKIFDIKFIEAKTESQIKRIADMAEITWREKYPAIIGEDQTEYMIEKYQSVEAITTQIQNENYTFYILKKNKADAGYIAIKPDGDELFLSKAYILEKFRGKGYFRQAVNFLAEIAKEKGKKSITLTVNKRNDSAEIYKKCGFIKTGEGKTDIGQGFFMDDDYYAFFVEQ
jgi:ribosomal protein S18 acetylase RimI-like enzyme